MLSRLEEIDLLGATDAIPIDARVVEDSPRFVSGGGVTSGLDVALYLVERELGPQIAHAVEKLFEYERRGTIWLAQGIVPIDFGMDSDEVDEEPKSPNSNLDTALGGIEAFLGEWETTISTPIGKMSVLLHINRRNGIIEGTAKQGDETVEFLNPVCEGTRMEWTQRLKKPMRLNLKFEVTVYGDVMRGTAKAGVLPASTVEGRRVH
ncbi:hypothetical protein GCM10008018_31120 [Paenibacillus marchantiophytorum]|uniref:DJ-1/PfpI family protein n=1 Tax=Paenibacillus marchantiophytorum TaxID=1619310 RepID=A0ABQ1ES37_9BACL|nr:hypothetical protein [Paenibacillus marchantiophytorum]GFZ82933.1 hypothetical protein GCM10008018_31120 [Paenibacillus marchantiophytorum]